MKLKLSVVIYAEKTWEKQPLDVRGGQQQGQAAWWREEEGERGAGDKHAGKHTWCHGVLDYGLNLHWTILLKRQEPKHTGVYTSQQQVTV